MAEPDEAPTPLDRLLDVLVYAPIGLGLDIETIGPDLARRGRNHAAVARQIGEFTVRAGVRKLDGVIASFLSSADTGVDEENHEPDPGSHLPIVGYDDLTAAEIVKLLDGLDPAEVEIVRSYEAANRGRRTILHKIARLQG